MKDTLLSFEKEFESALVLASCHDSDVMYLIRAAHVVRKEIFY